MRTLKPILDAISEKLTVEDDSRLWETALTVSTDLFLRRHESRWTAAGGFAWPEGYRNSLPEPDWTVMLSYRDSRWKPIQKLPERTW
jgi:hypothetical protein